MNTTTPLTLDDIRHRAPAAFTTHAAGQTSTRYRHIPTVAVIEHMLDKGFIAVQASQSASRLDGGANFAKHMIRFRDPQAAALDAADAIPEVVLVNSHNGGSSYQLMAGIFRLICTNGLIVADSLVGSVRVIHTGSAAEEVVAGSLELMDRMPHVTNTINRWRQQNLIPEHQEAFAEAAHAIRFADPDGKVSTDNVKPRQLLAARRRDDQANDLWTVFNRVQENVIKGGVGRRRTRQIKSIDRDVRLNRALWTLGERMSELLNAA
jgi:hypothetical protein